VKRTNPIAPFLRADPGSIVAGPWNLAGGGQLDGRVEHWDPFLVLNLERRVTVDVDRLVASSGEVEPGTLALAAMWRSTRTRLKGPGMSVSLGEGGGESTITLALDVPGTTTGGNLEVQTFLMLTGGTSPRSPIAAHRSGSVLWSDREVVALEGDAARFPLTVVDFAALNGISSDAPWSLEWYPHDLDQPVLGAMRLLVNSRNPVVVEAVGDAQAPESAAVASAIRFDVTRALVHGALGNEDFVTGPREFEPDTVGRVLCDLLDRYWPGIEPAALALRLTQTPHRLESELQTATGLMGP
jgi:hypothetical protein